MIQIAIVIASLIARYTYSALAADSISPRVFPSCGYVGDQIYCFGGDRAFVFNDAPNIDENIYSLNIREFVGQKSDIINNQWNKIAPAVPFQTEERRLAKVIVLSDKKRLLILGGYNKNSDKFINQTIIYDTSSNLWSNSSPFTDDIKIAKQIHSTTAVNLPDDSIGFYGGENQFVSFVNPPNWEFLGNSIGFEKFTMLNLSSGIWSSFSPQGSPLLKFYPSSQTATLNPRTGKIYYLGGVYDDAKSNIAPTIPFHWAAVFDTNSGDWLNETLHGEVPTNRRHHTANLLPNSPDVIVYGGSDDSFVASSNYCYTLNLENNTWTNKGNVNVPSHLSGPRFSHSAILVNSTLFILFGRGYNGDLSHSLLTIDVSDVSNITYTDTYISNTKLTTETAIDANTNPNGPTGLSKGAIGGISAGSIVACLGIIVFIFFYLRRQKRAKRQDTTEQMAVDWNEIENHFKDVPDAALVTGYTSASDHSSNLLKPSDNSNDISSTTNKKPDTVVDISKPFINLVDSYTTVKPHGK